MTSPITAEFLALQEVLAGRYSIERELGRGGMGIVLLARDVALERLVAIKLLPPELAANAEYRGRFLREARTAAGLSHPNIVPIHTVEEHGAFVFFVMGYVDGQTLRERVEHRGPLTPRLAMKVMQEVAWALGYAHQRGVVHRDIKPDNIMLEHATDRTIVTDFGIAIGRSGATARPGEVIGTARYMSPEQACGEAVDARSDLYSLGATCFYALTGRAPFEATTLPAIIAQHVSQPPPALREMRAAVPVRLADVVGRSLAKSAADRFQTAAEIASALGELRGRELRAPPLVRGFVRNAQITTMVFLATAVAGETVAVGDAGVSFSLGGQGIIGTILLAQLVLVARRLLREGYAFDDIREALLAEAQVQAEEADVIQQRRWTRRLGSLWHRLWAGRFGRWFFRMAGIGIRPSSRPVVPSREATELVLGRSVVAAYEALPDATRRQVGGVPGLVERLETQAEALRAGTDSGAMLTDTVAALENIRIALHRLQAGVGSVDDLTAFVERARAIGERVDRHLAGQREVQTLLGR